MEAYVAAIPGADAVDIAPLKEALQKQFAEPYGDVLPAEKRIQSAVATVDRIFAKAKGLSAFSDRLIALLSGQHLATANKLPL